MTEAQKKERREALQSCNLIFFILPGFRGNINRRKMARGCSASNDTKWFESDIDGELWEATINSLNASFFLCPPSGLQAQDWKKKDATAGRWLLPRNAAANTSSPSIVLEYCLTSTRKMWSEQLFLLYWIASIKTSGFLRLHTADDLQQLCKPVGEIPCFLRSAKALPTLRKLVPL